MNYRRARTTALVLLFFLGLSALPAGIFMVIDPMGEGMGLPLELLDHTPFSDFLIPGIILGLFNGILSLLFAVLLIRKHRFHIGMVMFQGAVLIIWLTTELIMGIWYPLLTIPYYLVALLLLVSGVRMRQSKTGLS
jgi:hypothetical protein